MHNPLYILYDVLQFTIICIVILLFFALTVLWSIDVEKQCNELFLEETVIYFR